MMIPSRRQFFGGGLGISAAALLSQQASADTLFTNFAFRATGAPTARTMPARLAEIKNVLDYGADPTGGNAAATTAAIQAAVDAIAVGGGGIVFFPLGFYSTSSPITFNAADLHIQFLGAGGNGTTISGNFNGYIFDRHLGSPSNTAEVLFERMNIANGFTTGGGAIRVGSSRQVTIRDVTPSGFICLTTEDSAGNSSQGIFIENCKFASPQAVVGSRGVILGGNGAMLGCDFISSDISVVAYGSGLIMGGNRIENSTTAYQLGKDSAGNAIGMSAFSINGSTEGNITSVDMVGLCTGGFIGPLAMLGHATSGPGQDTPTQYGIRVHADCAQGCVFFQLAPNSYFTVAGIAVENATARASNVFLGCLSTVGAGGGVPYIFPTNAYTAQFIQCNDQPIWTLSELPAGGNVLEGDEFNISDGTNGLAWGVTATNTGTHTTHYLVRWNGSNWTVVGK